MSSGHHAVNDNRYVRISVPAAHDGLARVLRSVYRPETEVVPDDMLDLLKKIDAASPSDDGAE